MTSTGAEIQIKNHLLQLLMIKDFKIEIYLKDIV